MVQEAVREISCVVNEPLDPCHTLIVLRPLSFLFHLEALILLGYLGKLDFSKYFAMNGFGFWGFQCRKDEPIDFDFSFQNDF